MGPKSEQVRHLSVPGKLNNYKSSFRPSYVLDKASCFMTVPNTSPHPTVHLCVCCVCMEYIPSPHPTVHLYMCCVRGVHPIPTSYCALVRVLCAWNTSLPHILLCTCTCVVCVEYIPSPHPTVHLYVCCVRGIHPFPTSYCVLVRVLCAWSTSHPHILLCTCTCVVCVEYIPSPHPTVHLYVCCVRGVHPFPTSYCALVHVLCAWSTSHPHILLCTCTCVVCVEYIPSPHPTVHLYMCCVRGVHPIPTSYCALVRVLCAWNTSLPHILLCTCTCVVCVEYIPSPHPTVHLYVCCVRVVHPFPTSYCALVRVLCAWSTSLPHILLCTCTCVVCVEYIPSPHPTVHLYVCCVRGVHPFPTSYCALVRVLCAWSTSHPHILLCTCTCVVCVEYIPSPHPTVHLYVCCVRGVHPFPTSYCALVRVLCAWSTSLPHILLCTCTCVVCVEYIPSPHPTVHLYVCCVCGVHPFPTSYCALVRVLCVWSTSLPHILLCTCTCVVCVEYIPSPHPTVHLYMCCVCGVHPFPTSYCALVRVLCAWSTSLPHILLCTCTCVVCVEYIPSPHPTVHLCVCCVRGVHPFPTSYCALVRVLCAWSTSLPHILLCTCTCVVCVEYIPSPHPTVHLYVCCVRGVHPFPTSYCALVRVLCAWSTSLPHILLCTCTCVVAWSTSLPHILLRTCTCVVCVEYIPSPHPTVHLYVCCVCGVHPFPTSYCALVRVLCAWSTSLPHILLCTCACVVCVEYIPSPHPTVHLYVCCVRGVHPFPTSYCALVHVLWRGVHPFPTSYCALVRVLCAWSTSHPHILLCTCTCVVAWSTSLPHILLCTCTCVVCVEYIPSPHPTVHLCVCCVRGVHPFPTSYCALVRVLCAWSTSLPHILLCTCTCVVAWSTSLPHILLCTCTCVVAWSTSLPHILLCTCTCVVCVEYIPSPHPTVHLYVCCGVEYIPSPHPTVHLYMCCVCGVHPFPTSYCALVRVLWRGVHPFPTSYCALVRVLCAWSTSLPHILLCTCTCVVCVEYIPSPHPTVHLYMCCGVEYIPSPHPTVHLYVCCVRGVHPIPTSYCALVHVLWRGVHPFPTSYCALVRVLCVWSSSLPHILLCTCTCVVAWSTSLPHVLLCTCTCVVCVEYIPSPRPTVHLYVCCVCGVHPFPTSYCALVHVLCV